MSAHLIKLKSITEELLRSKKDYYIMYNAVHALKKLFIEASGFDEMETASQQDILTKTGKAIAPRWAASCLTDLMRTWKFMLAIREAIEEKLKSNPGRPVTVLYAGTGPFATLLTPLITMFTPAQLQMVLLEINPVSIQHLKKIIQHFGMKEYIIELVETDAVTWTIPDTQQPDIVVAETMNNALQKEPQVSIVSNLLSQCKRNPFLIPELIKVEVCLLDDSLNNPDPVLPLKTLMELDAEMAIRIKNHPEKETVLSPGIMVTIPSLPYQSYTMLVLCTTIRLFGTHCIGFNESGLTIPHILRMANAEDKYPMRLLFRYQLENNPGFSVTKV